jgi:hypothetical protein
LLARLVPQSAGHVCFPGTGWASNDDVLVFLEVGAHSETGEQFGVDAAAGHGLEVAEIGGGLGETGVLA